MPYSQHRLIDRLAEPKDINAQAFHVVVPGLPGYGFTSPAPHKNWTSADTARLWNQLVTDVLGYERYVASAGDWVDHVCRYA